MPATKRKTDDKLTPRRRWVRCRHSGQRSRAGHRRLCPQCSPRWHHAFDRQTEEGQASSPGYRSKLPAHPTLQRPGTLGKVSVLRVRGSRSINAWWSAAPTDQSRNLNLEVTMGQSNQSGKLPQAGASRGRKNQPTEPDRPPPAATPAGAAPTDSTSAPVLPDAATVCDELGRLRVLVEFVAPGEGQWRLAVLLAEPLLRALGRAIQVLEEKS